MSTIKTVGTIGIMIACFAVVYPRFMHPLVLRAFGLQGETPKKTEDLTHPPGFKGMHPNMKPGMGQDEMRRMRHGPHPGMRAAAEMQKQQAQQGSGRGMMGIVLPMYAVGIVLYLVYTLFKVFNKSNNKNNSWNNRYQGGRRGQRDKSYSDDRMGFPMDFDGSEDVASFLQNKQQRKDLEELLSRVDDKNVSVDEMRLLQKRLEETEAQMTRILQAMQTVQTNVDNMATAEGNQPQESMPAQQEPRTTDSSPDMDTYEVVSRNGEESADGEKSEEKKPQGLSEQQEDAQDSGADGDEAEDCEEIVDKAEEEEIYKEDVEPDGKEEQEEEIMEQVRVAGKEEEDSEEHTVVRHRKSNLEHEQ